jgi:hypothetical protein
VVAKLKSVATILEDLAVILRQGPEGICSACATARLVQYPATERLHELVQEARSLKMDLQDLEGPIVPKVKNKARPRRSAIRRSCAYAGPYA